MTKRARTLLFFVLSFLFLVTAPAVVLFSQGYRIDWETKRFTQVGAFYFSVNPSPASIYVDGKLAGKTARFIGNSLTKNFLPKTYTVQISKEGYQTWGKNLEIRPSQVTETKNITLFPEEITFSVLREDIQRYWKAPDRLEAVVQINSEDGWALSILDFERNTEYEFYRPGGQNREISNVEWAPDATRVAFKITSGGEHQYFIHTLDPNLLDQEFVPAGNVNIIDLSFLDQNIERISFSPVSPEIIILSARTRNSSILYLADYEQKNLLDPITDDVISFAASGEFLYWLDGKGTVWRKDLSSLSPPKSLNTIPLSVQPDMVHEILFINDTIYIKQDKNLYKFDQQVQNFQIISVAAQQVVRSPDGNKIALVNESEISTYFLSDVTEQPHRNEGDHVFLTRFSRKVENLVWLNPYYIAFVLGDTIKAAEIDDRDHANIFDVFQLDASSANSTNPTFVWDANKRMLYLHDGNSIRLSSRVIE